MNDTSFRIERTFTVKGFSLEIGNNYTIDQFFTFLKDQHPAIVEALFSEDMNSGDTIVFEYKGSFSPHKDSFVVCDVLDHIK